MRLFVLAFYPNHHLYRPIGGGHEKETNEQEDPMKKAEALPLLFPW